MDRRFNDGRLREELTRELNRLRISIENSQKQDIREIRLEIKNLKEQIAELWQAIKKEESSQESLL